jgi:hypothetical protein
MRCRCDGCAPDCNGSLSDSLSLLRRRVQKVLRIRQILIFRDHFGRPR